MTHRCSECHNKVCLIGLHQEEIDAIGPDYICDDCLDDDDIDAAIDAREMGTYHARNGSVVG